MFKGIEPRQGFKQSFEGQASFFQEAHVRVAVRHQFFLEIKHLLFGTLLLMHFSNSCLALGPWFRACSNRGPGRVPRTFGVRGG